MTIYSIEALRTKKFLAEAGIKQAKKMGKPNVMRKITIDESIVLDNQIDAAIEDISVEELPSYFGSGAIAQ